MVTYGTVVTATCNRGLSRYYYYYYYYYYTAVTATCNRGFIMPDLQLTQSLKCVDENGSVAWNNVIQDCQRNYINFIDVSQSAKFHIRALTLNSTT